MADDRTRVAGNTTGSQSGADSTRVSATPVTPVMPTGDAGQAEFGVARRAARAPVQVGEGHRPAAVGHDDRGLGRRRARDLGQVHPVLPDEAGR